MTRALMMALLLSASEASAYLHTTTAEITNWQSRAASGPYKTSGDVSTNSPGDWDRIVTNKNSFVSSPSAQRWSGNTVASCYDLTGTNALRPGRTQGDRIRDAAFFYLVDGTTSVRDAVLAELLAQAAVAGADFSNGTRWCTSSPDDSDSAFSIGNFMTKLLFAYDYIRPGISGADQTTLDTWFLNAANYWESIVDLLVLNAFPDRNTDNYTTPTDAGLGSCINTLYYGGPNNSCWGEFWNNRSATIVRFFTSAGVLLNNSTLKNQGKRWFREWLIYNVFSDGTPGEYYRWAEGVPSLGWSYASYIIGSMVGVADVIARSGDTELYTFSSSSGRNGTAGGPKSLLQVLTTHLGAVNGTVVRYGTGIAGNNGNINYRIDSDDNAVSSEQPRIEDIFTAQANLYYQDTFVKSIYMRTASGAPAYPATPNSGGDNVYGGDWGIHAGLLFQFGQMEDNAANPFLGGGGGGAGLTGSVGLSGKVVVQ
jgi:hypothetical protein